MSIDGFHFLCSGIEQPDGTLIIPGYDTEEDMGQHPHTLLLAGQPGALEEIANTRWQTVAAGANADGTKIVLVSRWGRFLEFANLEDARSGVVDDDGEIEYRSVDRVGTSVYASGGGNTVRRLTDDGWVDESPPGSGGNLIEAVAGFSSDGSTDELYAFGWSGETWLREEGAWRQLDNVTDSRLQAAAAIGDRIVVGGQGGVVLEGRGDDWRACNDSGAEIWSVCEHGGEAYLSTTKGISRLVDGRLEPMDTSVLKRTHRLFSGPSGLWSVGGGTLGLYDGTAWRCVEQG